MALSNNIGDSRARMEPLFFTVTVQMLVSINTILLIGLFISTFSICNYNIKRIPSHAITC